MIDRRYLIDWQTLALMIDRYLPWWLTDTCSNDLTDTCSDDWQMTTVHWSMTMVTLGRQTLGTSSTFEVRVPAAVKRLDSTAMQQLKSPSSRWSLLLPEVTEVLEDMTDLGWSRSTRAGFSRLHLTLTLRSFGLFCSSGVGLESFWAELDTICYKMTTWCTLANIA